MQVFALTRQLIDIESVTPNEKAVGDFLASVLQDLTVRYHGTFERLPVAPGRDNLFACFGSPVVTLSTHMDTVPPFIPSSEDEQFIHGRGACDTKGIIASMIEAARALLERGETNFGLLFVVGEEVDSIGAHAASATPRGSRFLINGEPTSNRLAIASKGTMHFKLEAAGRNAHSGYPELGESAILKLLDALEAIRRVPLPVDPELGPSTLNVGVIQGGRARNVIPDAATADLFIRLVDDGHSTADAIHQAAAAHKVGSTLTHTNPVARFGTLPGFTTTVVAYATDVPAFEGQWGQPFLIGPGTINVAHTPQEHIAKREQVEAIEIYQRLVRQLIAQ